MSKIQDVASVLGSRLEEFDVSFHDDERRHQTPKTPSDERSPSLWVYKSVGPWHAKNVVCLFMLPLHGRSVGVIIMGFSHLSPPPPPPSAAVTRPPFGHTRTPTESLFNGILH